MDFDWKTELSIFFSVKTISSKPKIYDGIVHDMLSVSSGSYFRRPVKWFKTIAFVSVVSQVKDLYTGEVVNAVAGGMVANPSTSILHRRQSLTLSYHIICKGRKCNRITFLAQLLTIIVTETR